MVRVVLLSVLRLIWFSRDLWEEVSVLVRIGLGTPVGIGHAFNFNIVNREMYEALEGKLLVGVKQNA